MAAVGGIADDLLVSLAEDIETGEQMEALGRALGFKNAAINRYLETSRIEGRVTCKGTRDMLFDWRQTVNLDDQHSKLNQALTQANLIMLSQKYFKDTGSARGIDNKKISDSLNVLQCQKKLGNKYLNNLCKIPMKPWDKNDYAEFKDMHTRVTVVKKDARGRDTRKKDILHGSVSEIFSKKVNGKLPVRILISAAAGRGKTTAVAKMAYDWSHRIPGSALEHLPLLFVLKLRNSGQRISIGEAIKSQLLSDVTDLTPDLIEDFIRNNQDICHIIFDGLDEYAGISSSKQSEGSNMISIMRWEEYPECRVLVTTRPHLENFFNEGDLPKVYTKMEIEGFSIESSREYIDRFFASFSDSSMAEGLKTYLGRTPLVNELVITPLLCLMVCHLWTEGLLQDNVATQTELLDNVNVFLMHHANARSNLRVKITAGHLTKTISKLSKVALTGLLSDSKKLVFSPHDFRKVPNVLQRACDLGIVSKTTASSPGLPQSEETTSTTIEFYHKLAQEHSAGKHLAARTNKYLLRWRRSKLDRVLRKIRSHVGDYENLIRFTAGTKNTLCIRIMEAILINESLDESERYRILLDCSSETTPGTDGNVSSLVQRCVTSQTIVLKSPTLYTVVGMQNLPEELKRQVQEVTFNGSTITSDVTNGLWTCLTSFITLHSLTISDSSLSFPPSPTELPLVSKLTSKGVTSESYEGLLSSLPGLEAIDINIDDVERDISHISAGLHKTGGKQIKRISLESLPSQKKRSGCEHLSYYKNDRKLKIEECQLSAEVTSRLWSWLGTITKPHHLTISDSSLRFPSSPHELPHVTKLTAKRVTSQSYAGLLSSLPGLTDINITIDDAERFQIIGGLRQTGGEHLTLPLQEKKEWRQTMKGLGLVIREQIKELRKLYVSGIKCKDAEDLVELLVESSYHSGTLESLILEGGCVSIKNVKHANQGNSLKIEECQLSTELTDKLWSSLGPSTKLHSLTISNSSLSFPPSPPKFPYVRWLTAEGVTSQSYEGLLSSLPGLKVIDITIDDAERDISQITAGLQRTGREKLTHIRLEALESLPSEKRMVSKETMRGLSLLIREHTKNLVWLLMNGVECRDEDWIDLIKSCRQVTTMEYIILHVFETKEGSRLNSHLTGLDTSRGGILVMVYYVAYSWKEYYIHHV